MVISSIFAVMTSFGRVMARRLSFLYLGAFAAALLLAGCAVEVQNKEAGQELARLSKPPGSIYAGWLVYQERCVSCHGPDATGTAVGPNLLPRVQEMGPRRFVSSVLKRYDWGLLTQAVREGDGLDALIEEILQRKDGYAMKMPAWEGEPVVTAHIVDVYAYLSARAQGTQGPGRPVR